MKQVKIFIFFSFAPYVRYQVQELLLSAPVHMIAAVCFVKEAEANILGIKIGSVWIGFMYFYKFLVIFICRRSWKQQGRKRLGCHLLWCIGETFQGISRQQQFKRYKVYLLQSLAESICQVMGQGFQMVFSNAAAQYFDKKMVEGVQSSISFMASGMNNLVDAWISQIQFRF